MELVIHTTSKDRYCYGGIYVATPTNSVRLGRVSAGTVSTFLSYETFGGFGYMQGQPLESAKIRFKAYTTNTTNIPVIVRIFAWDVGAVSYPSGCAEIVNPPGGFTGDEGGDLFVEWTIEAWTADKWYETPELKTILQPVIDRGDFEDIAFSILESPNHPQGLPAHEHYFYSVANQEQENTELRLIFPDGSATPIGGGGGE